MGVIDEESKLIASILFTYLKGGVFSWLVFRVFKAIAVIFC